MAIESSEASHTGRHPEPLQTWRGVWRRCPRTLSGRYHDCRPLGRTRGGTRCPEGSKHRKVARVLGRDALSPAPRRAPKARDVEGHKGHPPPRPARAPLSKASWCRGEPQSPCYVKIL